MNFGSFLTFTANKSSVYYFTSRTCSLLLTKICIVQFGCMTISEVSTHISLITILLSSRSIQSIKSLTIPDFKTFIPPQVSHNHLNYYTANGWNNKLIWNSKFTIIPKKVLLCSKHPTGTIKRRNKQYGSLIMTPRQKEYSKYSLLTTICWKEKFNANKLNSGKIISCCLFKDSML